MYNVNISIFSRIILLVSLFCRIKSDFGVIKEQRQIASRPQLENNLDRTPSNSVITTAFTEDCEKFDDTELRKLIKQNFKLYENLERERNINGARGTARKTRDAPNDTHKQGMECLSCFASGNSEADEKCYKGKAPKTKCSEGGKCFVEVNPQYLRRGCMLTPTVNMTFHCRCPLCNDKPSNDYTYYDYKSVEDWLYDNFLLQKSLGSLDLMCKVCETTGTNQVADRKCKQGRGADYMVCGRNQLCYIDIDDEVDHVVRGCKTKPVYNSMYFFCNQTGCNDYEHKNPKTIFQTLRHSLVDSETTTTKTAAKKKKKTIRRRRKNSVEKIQWRLNLILTCSLFVKLFVN